jgi:hypothetical protein
MRCIKCGGFVVQDLLLNEDGGGWIPDFRCINCGKRFFEGQPLPERRRTLTYIRHGKEAHQKERRKDEDVCGN